MSQPFLLKLKAPIKVYGDIHGQYENLLDLFKLFNNDVKDSLFLGDYVDRGKNSIECISLLLAYKILYPQNFFLLRGNHETVSVNKNYGFFDEVKLRYSVKLYKSFSELFNCLPVAAIIDQKIFCCHGGLPRQENFLQTLEKTIRPHEVQDQGPICDLLWADPHDYPEKVLGFSSNDRGISHTFGGQVLQNFLKKNDFELFVRGHQVCEDGYQFFYKNIGLTIFSAVNYCGDYDNAGAVLMIDQDLLCSLKILKMTKGIFQNYAGLPLVTDLQNEMNSILKEHKIAQKEAQRKEKQKKSKPEKIKRGKSDSSSQTLKTNLSNSSENSKASAAAVNNKNS